MVPVVDAIAVKIRLTDFGPVLVWVTSGVSILPETFFHRSAKGRVLLLSSFAIDRTERRVDGVE